MQQGGLRKDTRVLGRPGFSPFRANAIEESTPLPLAHATGALPSRVADNLYWPGRYAERVEALVRLLRTILPALSGKEDAFHDVSLDAVLRLLTSFKYLPGEVPTMPLAEQLHPIETMLTSMIHDPAGISPLGCHLKRMRQAAWPVKERLSSDTWRVLQQIEIGTTLPASPFLFKRPATVMLLLDQTITNLSAFAGLLSDSTTRGHGWRFLEIGRRLERALQTMDLLRHAIVHPEVRPSRNPRPPRASKSGRRSSPSALCA
jgi:uncharacterized alpha-E superfamily protein